MKKKTKKTDILNRFNSMLSINIFADIVIIVLGIFLFFEPSLTNKIIGSLIGGALIIYAASMIYSYISRDGAKLYSLNIIFGTVIALIGLLLIVYPYTVIDFIKIALGIYIMITGATKINYAMWLKKGKEESWLITLLTGLLLIGVSLIFMFSSFITITITRVIGIFLICSSVLNIMDVMLFKKRSKEIVKIFW